MKLMKAAALAVGILLLSGIAFAAAPAPMEQVRTTVDQVIEVLKEKELRGAARRQKLSSLIRPRFDFQLMAQWVLGTNWRKATAEEKSRFVALFADTLEETYIGKIENYTDEKVKYVGERIDGEQAEVDTFIVSKSVEIPLKYKVVRKGEQWMVYDVVVEGVSLVRNFRSTYDEIVRKEGLGGLLVRMEEKLREIRRNNSAGAGKAS